MKTIILTLSLLLCLTGIAYQGEPCKGITTKGTRCKITVGVNKDGYCRLHDPNAERCTANTKSGTRCKIVVKKGENKCSIHNKNK